MGDSAYPPGFSAQPPRPWNPNDDPRQGGNPAFPPGAQEGTAAPGRSFNNAPKLVYPGYEGTNFQQGYPVPPPPRPPGPRPEPPPLPNTDMAKLDEDGCRSAMIQHVSEHCCYGSKPAKEMKITQIEGVTALHLTLETFTEGRTTKNKNEPYRGGMVDGPQNGRPPGPWEMDVQPQEMFSDHKIKKEVPHTSEIKPCWECECKGWNTCWRCHGCGRIRCNSCDGQGYNMRHTPEGHQHRETCHWCHGDGRRSCDTCGGDGRVTCRECDGYRYLRCFIQLVCKYVNHNDDFILETTDMPDELVASVGGTVLFQDCQYLVRPIVSYPVAAVNANSERLVKDHDRKWPAERSLKQRQTLRGVPVTEVDYTWDDVKTRFWVYGNERAVYAPDYPQQCCCGCSII